MSKKIEKLTPAQEAAMPLYVEKWTKIGLSTEPSNKSRAIANVPAYYKAGGLEAPKVTVFAASPFAAQILASLLSTNGYVDYVISADDGIEYTKTALQNITSIENTAASEKFFTSVATAAVNAARDLGKALDVGGAKAKKPKFSLAWHEICGGNLWASWQAFYDFFKTEVGVAGLEIIDPTIALSQDSGWIIPFENLCILTEKPNKLSLNKEGLLHCADGAAIAWSDGFELYYLNGTKVPRYLAVEAPVDLNPKQVLSEENVEVRMQGVKKIGPAALIKNLGAKVLDEAKYDAGGKYKLLQVDWTGSPRLYLEMVNPSTGEVCIEPVHPECQNVEQALGFRMEGVIGEAWKQKNFTYTVPKIYT